MFSFIEPFTNWQNSEGGGAERVTNICHHFGKDNLEDDEDETMMRIIRSIITIRMERTMGLIVTIKMVEVACWPIN